MRGEIFRVSAHVGLHCNANERANREMAYRDYGYGNFTNLRAGFPLSQARAKSRSDPSWRSLLRKAPRK